MVAHKPYVWQWPPIKVEVQASGLINVLFPRHCYAASHHKPFYWIINFGRAQCNCLCALNQNTTAIATTLRDTAHSAHIAVSWRIQKPCSFGTTTEKSLIFILSFESASGWVFLNYWCLFSCTLEQINHVKCTSAMMTT